MSSTTVRVNYHHEPDGWWADSPDVAGFVASGASLKEVRDLVREGLPFYLEQPDVEIAEATPTDGLVVDVQYTGVAQASGAQSFKGSIKTTSSARSPVWE